MFRYYLWLIDHSRRTTSWAANLPSRPPPLPTSSVPGTPILSRYRIARPILKDNSSKSVDHDQYFTQSDEPMPIMGNKVTSILNRPNGVKVHCTKPSTLYFNSQHPPLDFSEAKITRRPNPRGGMVIENLSFRNNINDSVHTSLSSLEISSNNLQQSGIFE